MRRRFGENIPEIEPRPDPAARGADDQERLISWIRKNEIGVDTVIETPFGRREAIYCDYTASARAIRPIEDYITANVLPLYGNTHSSVTVTSEQTTLFVHEARQEIRAMTGAGDGDSVLFVGSGSTAAVELLIHLMKPKNLVVIMSIHEHHSNMLPWRSVAEACYYVGESSDGRIDCDDLEKLLEEVQRTHSQSQVLVALSACSNVTGICMDVSRITALVKRHNALIVWDYASSAPYVDMNVNGAHPIDAVFFSGHKFLGGVSTPGVLVVKKSLMKAAEPKRIGGGTVFFVSSSGEWYLKDAEYREEGGTPDSVGIIRLALAVKLKRAIGEKNIATLERRNTERLLSGLNTCSNVVLLGAPTTRNRLTVFSFLVKDPSSGLFFHHNYVSALLNDLFGIQSRAGCMCAGPYAQHLMGISDELALEYLNALRESDGLDRTHLRRVGEYSSNEALRPGFTRVSVPYFWSDKQVDHLVECIRFVSERAADFIHLYQLNCESAEWHHHKQRTFHARKWLGHVSFTGNGMLVDEKKKNPVTAVPREAVLAEAHRLADECLEALEKVAERSRGIPVKFPTLPYRPREYPTIIVESWDEVVKSTEVKITADASDVAQPEADQSGPDDDSELQCKPSDSGDNSTMECPLDAGDRGKGKLGEFGTDEEPETAKTMEDWDRRVIVNRKELTKSEEAQLPWKNPPLEMYRRVTEAIHGLEMIKEGDKVLVCLSGGKDSLSLLHILHFYQMRCRKNKSTNFELGAITVDPGSTAYNPRPLIEYCRSLNIDYFYEEQDIIGAARKLDTVRSICAFCSRMKRGRLAAAAQLHGWNVLAMGQHLDDVAESLPPICPL
ncbi:hypothetical protein Q1695_016255 [Nippostrongylus brasiliensis]|nr:hypothetical protein Q1695_016255 [Nippostrongylus brasiliensis]